MGRFLTLKEFYLFLLEMTRQVYQLRTPCQTVSVVSCLQPASDNKVDLEEHQLAVELNRLAN